MARKRKDVQNELSQKLSDMRAIMDKPEEQEKLRALQAEVESLTEELNRINVDEAAERAIAASRIPDDVKEAARQFSFSKFSVNWHPVRGLAVLSRKWHNLQKKKVAVPV